MNETLTLGDFFDAWELFGDSALAGTIAGALLGFLGVYIVLQRMIFLSAALSQTAGFGVTLAFYAQVHLGMAGFFVSPIAGASIMTFAATLALMAGRGANATYRDRNLGLVFLMGSAGTLVVGTTIVQEIHDIETLLFGTAVAVPPEEFRMLWITAAVVGAVHLWWWRGFAAVANDMDGARVRGLPTRLLGALLLLTLAVCTSVSTSVLGALPTFAFSVLPAMAALRVTPNIKYAMVVAGIIGAACGFWGYALAFVQSWPVGASQTLLGVGVAVTMTALGTLRDRLKSATARKGSTEVGS